MRFLPAPPNTGIRFRRVDLEGQPEVEARIEHVSDTSRSTTLAKGNVKIHTVEHVLATFAGYGIDNAIVELDANEPPVGDGSARDYCRMVEEAGIALQPERRELFQVSEPIELVQGDTILNVFPHDRFRVSCTSADKQARYTQFYSLEVTPDTWKREIAPARTFCFFEEIEFLIKNGLIKGGSLQNAVVIRDDAVLTTEPLRYPEEFVRHKILDLIGDLALLGRPLSAHVVAIKTNHNANCALARLLSAQMYRPLRVAQSFTPPPPLVSGPGETTEMRSLQNDSAMDTIELMRLVPHRYPFLMVDRIVKIEGNKITGIKNVTANEPYFQGHFPGYPIMPGVLQLEAIAQVAGVLMLRQVEHLGKFAYFMSAESVKWRKPVRPGDILTIQVELTKSRGKIGKASGTCLVAGEVVSEAKVTFMVG
jgi:UDP-3-O-[3-hydroxymyristoyl] N-acetylglucosamine deacetylase/3-hydroxyacyl-[acyl-carrier-protein] dehydratase